MRFSLEEYKQQSCMCILKNIKHTYKNVEYYSLNLMSRNLLFFMIHKTFFNTSIFKLSYYKNISQPETENFKYALVNEFLSNIFLISYYSMFSRIYVFRRLFSGPDFLGSRFFRVQVFQSLDFSGSRFLWFQVFQATCFSGSRFLKLRVQGPGSGISISPFKE